MSILNPQAIPHLPIAIRGYDLRVILSVTVLSRLFLAAIYFAYAGPSLSGTDLINAIALP
ncbi:hypothetical protein I3J27_27755 [Bradyrhizobium xenonodulans]|uniref:MFS transporter n=1 Tax=Bradyrhizobium xenonodulans TaxID=2736875 RepID=A0ABY7MEH3_9BRAD|nr:hypothetical protein [Bradyrhizobium xenonodulans]WBL76792.1 hypothetical protein I3J27_27755 [Bradyrhizobium xenonodulans]